MVLALLSVLAGVGVLVQSRFLPQRGASNAAVPQTAMALPPDPPQPILTVNSTGVQVARVDAKGMEAWALALSLPIPPVLDEAEPPVAEALVAALREAARQRSAAAFGRVGQICESLEGHRSAEEYFRLAANADPRDHRWPYYLGCIAQVTGRRDEAVDRFNQAKALNADYPVTYARLAQLYLEMERDDDAAAMSQRYAALRPRDWLGFVGLGRVALHRGDPSTALRYFLEAVERGPRDFQAHYYLAKTYAALGQEEKARQHFASSAKLPRGEWFHHRDPLDQELHRSTESSAALEDELEGLDKSEDWPRLAKLAERILERRPQDVNMMGNLASFYRKMGRFEEAHGILEKALEVAPGEASIHRRRAELYLAQGKPGETLGCVEEARKLAPPDVATHSVEGRALYLLKRFPEAEAAMRRAVEMAPDNPGNIFVLAEILRAVGRIEEAIPHYRRVAELRPDDAGARKRLAELEGSPSRPPP